MKKSSFLWGHRRGVSTVDTAEDFQKQVVAFGHALGFDTINAMLVIDQPLSEPQFYIVDNTPLAYLEAYYDRSLARVDPVMQYCKLTSQPIVWNQATYTSNRVGGMWEHQARYGFKAGVAVALHSPGGRHFFMGIDRDGDIETTPAVRAEIIERLQIFAEHAREIAFKLFDPDANSFTPKEPLNAVELEVLRWSMDGNTPWEIGEAINMSQEMVSAAIHSSMRKLRCTTKYQAVIRAIKIGLLS